MMATEDFDKWLEDKLLRLNPDVDLSVFASYIKSILEDEDEDQKESVAGMIAEITVSCCGQWAIIRAIEYFLAA